MFLVLPSKYIKKVNRAQEARMEKNIKRNFFTDKNLTQKENR